MAEDVPRIEPGYDGGSLSPHERRLLGWESLDFFHWTGEGRFWILNDSGALVGPGRRTDHSPSYAYHSGANVTVTLDGGKLSFDKGRGEIAVQVPAGLEVVFFVSIFNSGAAMHVRLM
eukprot:TRINITY_DN12469_c0_g1_i2.p1 TRINITY_DN12469_c0_g1~~TRINITY_DN12469_c0_g1_i2.p1  ORF type:complete len:118 (+),score=23.24 TRINITY_DN12469_c0_g1_i2:265-618(+)